MKINQSLMFRSVLAICYTGLILFAQIIRAQPVHEGEKFPVGHIYGTANYSSPQFDVPEKSGKYIVVDVFTSGCIVCFKKLPLINELQKAYKDKISFLLLGKTDKYISGIYDRFKEKYHIDLPVVYDSALIRKLEIESFPCYIWIDPGGNVVAVTGAEAVSPSNLELFVKGKPLVRHTPVQVQEFNPSKLYLVNGNGGTDSHFLLRSVLTRFNKGQPMITPPRMDTSKLEFQVLGATREQLYLYAFLGMAIWGPGNREYDQFYPFPVLESNDQPQIRAQHDSLYNYSLLIPEGQRGGNSLMHFMQQDLDRYFGLNACLEWRYLPVWALRKTEGVGNFRQSSSDHFQGYFNHAGIDVKGFPMDSFLRFLYNYHQLDWPILNETGMHGNIDVSFAAVMSDMPDLQNGLKKAGLELVPEHKLMLAVIYKTEEKKLAASQ